MFDNRGLIRKLAEFDPNYKLFILAPKGDDEIVAYGVNEEDVKVVDGIITIDLSKHTIEKLEESPVPGDPVEAEEPKEEAVEEAPEEILEETENEPAQEELPEKPEDSETKVEKTKEKSSKMRV